MKLSLFDDIIKYFYPEPIEKRWIGNILALFTDNKNVTICKYYYILFLVNGKRTCELSIDSDTIKQLKEWGYNVYSHPRYINQIMPWLHNEDFQIDERLFIAEPKNR